MGNLISGIFSVLLIIVFLGFYIWKVPSVPLGIIIVGVCVMIVVEFFESIGGENGASKY